MTDQERERNANLLRAGEMIAAKTAKAFEILTAPGAPCGPHPDYPKSVEETKKWHAFIKDILEDAALNADPDVLSNTSVEELVKQFLIFLDKIAMPSGLMPDQIAEWKWRKQREAELEKEEEKDNENLSEEEFAQVLNKMVRQGWIFEDGERIYGTEKAHTNLDEYHKQFEQAWRGVVSKRLPRQRRG